MNWKGCLSSKNVTIEYDKLRFVEETTPSFV